MAIARRGDRLPRLRDADLPPVSILIPCHNEERVIANTLRGVLKLDHPAGKLQILAINDGSTDRTAEAILSLSKDGRVMLIDIPASEAARGKSAALNCGGVRTPLVNSHLRCRQHA